MKTEEFVGGKTIGNVPVALMAIDTAYQRETRQRVLTRLIAEFDIERCGILTVSERDGLYYVVDGQHRYLAARANGIKELCCEIRRGLSPYQEAEIFARQNVNVTKLRPVDMYKAECFVNRPDSLYVTINEGIAKYGFKVSSSTSVKGFHSLTHLARSLALFGSDFLDYICRIIKSAGWEPYWAAFGTKTNELIANAFSKGLAADAVGKVLRGFTPESFFNEALARYKEASNGARAKLLVDLLNQG